jgi:hypothetical protein
MKNVDLLSDLKKWLLFSSIGLAIVASVIFISVVCHLSYDLGESLELDHSNHMMSQLTTGVKEIINVDKFNKLILNKKSQNELIDLLGKEVIGIEIWFDKTPIKLKASPLYCQRDDISNAIRANIFI